MIKKSKVPLWKITAHKVGKQWNTPTVISATELTLCQKYQLRQIIGICDFNVDASLIGGILIKIGSFLYDNTISKKLNELGNKLY